MTNTNEAYPRSVLVTGALGGIGSEICLHFAREGSHVVMHDQIAPEGSEVVEMHDRLLSAGAASSHYFQADLRVVEQIDKLFVELSEAGVVVDVLINNAGIQRTAPIEAFDLPMWNDIIAINLTAVYRFSQLALAGMRERGAGRIINLASVHGLVGSPNKAAYVAAKHGVVGLTKVLALETAQQNITVNAISPGWTDTPILDSQIEQRMAELESSREEAVRHLVGEKQPTCQLVPPSQIAALVGFLASTRARHITGATMPVDGGWTCQ